MRHHTLAFSLLVLLAAACDSDDVPQTIPSLRPVAVRIDGPALVNSPAQVQFTAHQTWSDGSSRDVTRAAVWSSTNPAVLSITAGSATASSGGEVGLTARFDQLVSQTVTVRVVPATPEWNGAFTLSVGGGTCSGSIPLPPELRQRTYTAFIQQTGLTLNVSVPGVGFFAGQIFNPQVRFYLSGTLVSAGRARKASLEKGRPGGSRFVNSRYEPRFFPARYLEPPQSLSELLPDGNRLAIAGSALTTISPSGFTGTFSGSLALYELARGALLGVCFSPSHGFTLVRN